MSETQVYGTYKVVATVSVLTMALIAMIALKSLQHISDGGMFAIALMVLSPGILGIGVSYFIYLSSARAADGARRRDALLTDDGIREIGRP